MTLLIHRKHAPQVFSYAIPNARTVVDIIQRQSGMDYYMFAQIDCYDSVEKSPRDIIEFIQSLGISIFVDAGISSDFAHIFFITENDWNMFTLVTEQSESMLTADVVMFFSLKSEADISADLTTQELQDLSDYEEDVWGDMVCSPHYYDYDD